MLEQEEISLLNEHRECREVQECAAFLRERMFAYLHFRLQKRTFFSESTYFSLINALKRPAIDQFAGRFFSASQWYAQMKNGANLRESLANVWLFFNLIFSVDAVGKNASPCFEEIAYSAGFDIEKINFYRRKAGDFYRQKHNLTAESNEEILARLEPKQDFAKLYWHESRFLQEQSRILISSDLEKSWTFEKRNDFLRSGGVFSETEKRLTSPRGRDFLPWLDARRLSVFNPAADINRFALSQGFALQTGLSGVSLQIGAAGEMFACRNRQSIAKSCLLYLVPLKTHSIFEVLYVADYFPDSQIKSIPELQKFYEKIRERKAAFTKN
jgi:hypothetical protein